MGTPEKKRAVDQAWQTDRKVRKTARARASSQLSLDESVANAIYDHFLRKGWTAEQVDTAKNKDGQ
eukprot:2593845-Amphidinium_carterae.1